MKKKKDFYEFCRIVEKLRAPDGCPWDREQTHSSLLKHLLEEAYEAADAIMENDSEKMADELGDVLLQIVMHAQIGKEEGTFTIDDVTDAVSNKMIQRHPHVFGDVKVSGSEEVLDNWEEIKKAQRGQKTVYEAMASVTKSLPALSKTTKIIGKAVKGNLYSVEDKQSATGEEIGQKLFDICALAYKNGIDPESELALFTKKFIKNFKNIEENT
ncbi:MAG: MazG family protein [Clostridia bacterium]|nr:MazG family protein [Clostridia bacterium]